MCKERFPDQKVKSMMQLSPQKGNRVESHTGFILIFLPRYTAVNFALQFDQVRSRDTEKVVAS